MSTNVTVNGVIYPVPTTGDTSWGDPATNVIVALATYTLQLNGGSFPITADVNFGSSYGLIAPYFKSSSSNIAASGVLRLAKGDVIAWRNEANSADVTLRKKSASDTLLQYGGVDLVDISTAQTINGKNFGDVASLDASAIFQTTSTTKGSIPAPKMTTTQRNAISAPVSGLQIFNTTTGYIEFYDGSQWVSGATSSVAPNIYLWEVFN